ncbi:MAG: ABC transporter ATP-binding protein/permease [Lachnospiraceae bacterium]|nr:ABC transporter ATP-binding protein/permease [Lachnospiraceae bacterium]
MARTLENLQKQYNSTAAASNRGPMAATNNFKGKPANSRATIARIFSYVGMYWKRLILVLLCMLLTTAASLAGGYVLRPVINHIADASISAAQRVSYLAMMLGVLAAIYLTAVCGTWLQSRMMIGISRSAIEKIRNELFTRVEKLPLSFHDNQTTGELMSRFTNDVDNIGMMLDQSLMSLVSGIINLVGTLVMMIYTNIWLTLITLVFIPVFALGGQFLIRKSRRYYSAQQAALGAANGYIEESVAGQKVVKVFNHESDCEQEFGLLNGDLRGKQMKAMFFGGIMGPVMGNTSQISYALTAGIGGVLCALGRFDVGGLAIFVNYSRQFSRPINEISQQMATIFSALAGAERVFGLMDRAPETADAAEIQCPEKLEGHVILDDVSFGYVPGKTVLKHISLYAKPGQKIAFVGSTGAGKTTITNLLNRFYDIDSGRITIDGVDIQKLPRDFLRRNIAMVLQDTHLFTGTIMENIRYGRLDATDDEVIAAARTASADSFIRRLSEGYNTVIEGDGANLSQGQRQLLNIARAALSKAPILVLDEATSSVDTRTERHIEKGMDRLMRDRTTFVIAHRLSTVRNANAIMVLEHGEIIERGDHDDLLAQKGRYYELYTGVKELD